MKGNTNTTDLRVSKSISIQNLQLVKIQNVVIAYSAGWIDSRNTTIPSGYRPKIETRSVSLQLAADGSDSQTSMIRFGSSGTITCDKYPYFLGTFAWETL